MIRTDTICFRHFGKGDCESLLRVWWNLVAGYELLGLVEFFNPSRQARLSQGADLIVEVTDKDDAPISTEARRMKSMAEAARRGSVVNGCVRC